MKLRSVILMELQQSQYTQLILKKRVLSGIVHHLGKYDIIIRLLLGLTPPHQKFLNFKNSNTQPHLHNSTNTALQHTISIPNCSLKEKLLNNIKIISRKVVFVEL